ncbi:uncharacterized protein KY384_008286 [Bacidia gigantensis]|uniref:uncharacterized protein n=1 Tax=Bacidia gigantensis TaxID=2732470 RepID=UPI001D045B02|nr:uncharacterized protein KY384_008286 [Bacidia gigantensis]KAG8526857.1 hypothetical protein KY384_008286 [Bacidia gigantensis]
MSSTACCSGFEHSGEPKGRVESLHGLPTYVAEPSNNAEIKAVIVMIPDAFGWEFVNLRLQSDIFADRLGVQCLLPDFMNGQFEIAVMYGWSEVQSLTDAIRLAHGTEITNSGKPLIDVAYVAHPSALELPVDIEKISMPTLISQGTEDFVLDKKGIKVIQEVFEKKKTEAREGSEGQRYDIKVIEGAMHGFAVRGDPDDKAELEYAQIGEDQAVEWFKQWLVKT